MLYPLSYGRSGVSNGLVYQDFLPFGDRVVATSRLLACGRGWSRRAVRTRSCAVLRHAPGFLATCAPLTVPADDRDSSNQSCARGSGTVPMSPTARFLLLLSFMAAGRPITCPLCGSQNLVRLNDEEVPGTMTVVVRYLCNKCHAVFTRQPVKAASQEIARSPAPGPRRF